MKPFIDRKKGIEKERLTMINTSRDMCESYNGAYNSETGMCAIRQIIDNRQKNMFFHCVVCGKPFEPTNCNTEVCSEECKIGRAHV